MIQKCKRYNLMLDEEDQNLLADECSKMQTSVSCMIRNLIKDFLNDFKKEEKMANFNIVRKDFDSLFDRIFDNRMFSLIGDDALSSFNSFPVEVKDCGEFFEVLAEVPGAKKEEIDLSVDKNNLSIIVNKSSVETKENERILFSELRTNSRISRTLHLPQPIDENKIQASLISGFLKIVLPKLEEIHLKRIEINEVETE